jgi:hypothetical protein
VWVTGRSEDASNPQGRGGIPFIVYSGNFCEG